MALRLVLDDLDGLPDDVAKEYVERDGKFYLDWVEADGLRVEDVGGLKTALEKERQLARESVARLKKYEGIDDPAAARDALRKVGEMADWDPDKEVSERMKAREKQLLEQHQRDTRVLEDKLENAESQLERNLIIAAATEALQKAGGRIHLMLPHVLGNVRMRRTDEGAYLAEVVDEGGTPRVGDSAGNPMTIPQLVEEMRGRDEFTAGFDGTGQSGTGRDGKRVDRPPRRKPSSTAKVGDDGVLHVGSDEELEKIATGEVEVDIEE
jgi:hypothetical protein